MVGTIISPEAGGRFNHRRNGSKGRTRRYGMRSVWTNLTISKYTFWTQTSTLITSSVLISVRLTSESRVRPCRSFPERIVRSSDGVPCEDPDSLHALLHVCEIEFVRHHDSQTISSVQLHSIVRSKKTPDARILTPQEVTSWKSQAFAGMVRS